MPYNVISTTYIAKFKINSNTKIEVFYKDKNLVSVSKVYKVQYNSNGIIRQLIGNDIKYYDYYDDDDKDDDEDDDKDDEIDYFNMLGKKNISFDVLKDGIIVDININDDDDDKDDEDDKDNKDDKDDKLINMPSSFVICKENLKTPFQDCVKKWESLCYKKRVEFYTTYKAELNIKT